MKRHLNCFRNSKNNFLLHFDAFLTLIFSLEKWAFWVFLAFFRPKSPKSEKVQFSSAWKRCNFSFFSLENFFFRKFRRFRIFLHTFWVSKSKNSKIQRGCRGRVKILSLVRFVATDSTHFRPFFQKFSKSWEKIKYFSYLNQFIWIKTLEDTVNWK